MGIRMQWDMTAFRELRTSPEVTALIQEKVEAVAQACGDGYEATVTQSPRRARGKVSTVTPQAMASNAKNNTLLNNLNAAR